MDLDCREDDSVSFVFEKPFMLGLGPRRAGLQASRRTCRDGGQPACGSLDDVLSVSLLL